MFKRVLEEWPQERIVNRNQNLACVAVRRGQGGNRSNVNQRLGGIGWWRQINEPRSRANLVGGLPLR